MRALSRGIQPHSMILIDKEEEELFNFYMNEYGFDDSLNSNLEFNKTSWFYPDVYNDINLRDYFLARCKTQIEKDRVNTEIDLYTQFSMESLLRWAIWFMDTVKEKNLFIGVGRGSSVSSYCLYLIELHLIDSIKWDLDCTNFLH